MRVMEILGLFKNLGIFGLLWILWVGLHSKVIRDVRDSGPNRVRFMVIKISSQY